MKEEHYFICVEKEGPLSTGHCKKEKLDSVALRKGPTIQVH
jgi:hypothetical protein